MGISRTSGKMVLIQEMDNACYLCGDTKHILRSGTVRDNPELKVLECVGCGLVFLSSFKHIEDRFYETSGMHEHPIDIDEWLKKSAVDDVRRFRQFRLTIENKSVLDFGCGAGGFLLQARDVAVRACGVEVEARLAPFFNNNALDVRRKIDDFDEKFDIITLFHVLEHFSDPIQLLLRLADHLNPSGQILIEVPNANDALLTLYECEAFASFTYWSCHLFLFNASTLSTLARKCGLTVNYMQHIQRYSPANHLYWLSQGSPGGHVKWDFLDSDDQSVAYEKSLAAIGRTDSLVCSLSKPVTNQSMPLV